MTAKETSGLNLSSKDKTEEEPFFVRYEDGRTFIDLGAMQRKLGRPLNDDELKAISIIGEANIFGDTIEERIKKWKAAGLDVPNTVILLINDIAGSNIQNI